MLKICTVFLLLILVSTQLMADSTEDAASRIDAYLKRANENGYSGSVLVASGNDIVLEKGYGFASESTATPCTPETIFDIGSITKQFTAAAILKLEMQKKLSTQDLISKYLDGVPPDKAEITIHHLLTHTAGLVDSLGADEEWIGREDYLKAAFQSELIHAPGSYDYSNVGYSLLAAIVEKASGIEYEQYLRDNLLLPAGMKNTGYVLPKWDKGKMAIGYQNGRAWGTTYDQSHYDKGVTWHLKGNGGIHSTVQDLYRWCLALESDQILSSEARKKYFAPHVKELEGSESYYGYGWVVVRNQRGETVVTHNGGNGFFMATVEMIPDRKSAIIVTTNHIPKNTDDISRKIDRILFEDYRGLDPSFRERYSGTYSLPSGARFEISFDENDDAIVKQNNRESFLGISGSQWDDEKIAASYDTKTEAMIQAWLGADVAAAVRLSGSDSPSDDEIEQMKMMKADMEEEIGKSKDVHILGSVARRGGEYYLTVAEFKGEKKDAYRMFIWRQDRIFDIRELPQGNTKNFDFQEGSKFHSATNATTLTFSQDAKGEAVTIQRKGFEISARRVQDHSVAIEN